MISGIAHGRTDWCCIGREELSRSGWRSFADKRGTGVVAADAFAMPVGLIPARHDRRAYLHEPSLR